MGQLEDRVSNSDEIGYIEYLQNLNMITIQILADFKDLEPEPEQIQQFIIPAQQVERIPFLNFDQPEPTLDK